MGVLKHGISCAGCASEEMDDVVIFNDEISNNSKYVVMFDPVDGGNNIDVNIPSAQFSAFIKEERDWQAL